MIAGVEGEGEGLGEDRIGSIVIINIELRIIVGSHRL